MRIICDTNVLVSGVLFGGPPRSILKKAARGELELCTSPELLDEAERVLRRPKFCLTPQQVSAILSLFRDTFELVHPSRRVSVIIEDPSDNRVLEAAEAAAAHLIVSGDKHLLALQRWNDLEIVSPAQFLALG